MPPNDDARQSTTLVRDLISVGVFTALYFVVLAVVGQLGALVPIGQVLGPFYIPILCGIPFMLFLTRVQRFGLITAMGVLVGLLFLVTGQAWTTLALGFVLGLLADGIAFLGRYRRWPMLLASYVIFAEISIGMVVPLFFQRNDVIARLSKRHDTTWVNQIISLTPPWMFYVMIGMVVVGAVIGAYIGRGIFRKHFAYLGKKQ